MSYFADMLRHSGPGFQGWLLLIGSKGAAVAYRLDADGKPVDMVAGTVEEVIGAAVKESLPRSRLLSLPGYGYAATFPPDSPHYYGFFQVTWHEVASAMNEKNVRAGGYREEYRLYQRLFGINYIEECARRPIFRLTDAGVAADERILSELREKEGSGHADPEQAP